MIVNNIRIKQIKVGELIDFAEAVLDKLKPGDFVPISMQRAISQANNPYAEADDVGLLAAIDEDDKVVGYFGILPILLRSGGEVFKIHWFTTWAVSSKVRGKGVGTDLMREALTLKKDYLIVGSVHARRVCKKFGFWEREPLRYYWIDMSAMGRLNPITWILRMLRKITHIFNINKDIAITNSLTRLVDASFSPITKQLFFFLLSRKFAGILREFDYQEVSRIRHDLPPQNERPEVELNRGIEAVNWMLSYPWIMESGGSRTEQMDYQFSDTRPLYRLIALEIYSPNTQDFQGFVVFSVSRKRSGVAMKTLDFHFRDPSQYQFILALAIQYGKQYQADTIEIPEEVVSSFKVSVLGRLLLQEKKRIYQCHPKADDSPLANAWEELTRHLYDGDMAFS